MASPAVDPPEGFILDGDKQPGNAMASRRGAMGRLAVSPEFIPALARGVGNAMAEPFFAAERLLQRGYHPGQEDENAVRDSLAASGAAMTGGLGTNLLRGAEANAVGMAGAKITPEQVVEWLERANVKARVKRADQGTTYVETEPVNAPRSGGERPVVRIPDDEHIGRPLHRKEVGSRFDTGTSEELRTGARRDPVDPRATTNQAGEPLSEWENLEAALKWRLSASPDGQFLVPPDKAPHHRPPAQEPPRPASKEAGPQQLKLLAASPPIPTEGGWETTVEREPDAGRFARPIHNAMASETRELTEQVRQAASDIATQDFGLPPGFVVDEPNTTTIPKTRNAMRPPI